MRPRIAVNCDVEISGRERFFLYSDYADALIEAGAEPVVLSPDPAMLPQLRELDGVLLTGGDDYTFSVADPAAPPARYVEMHSRRERFDISLAQEALRLDLPLLGICAGFQLVARLTGGELIGDIEEEVGSEVHHRRRSPEDEDPRHEVTWEAPPPPGVEGQSSDVMSRHHQGVRSLGHGWSTWASAPDGMIEGAIGPGRWQLLVQWHPELSPRDRLSRSIFTALVAAARTTARS